MAGVISSLESAIEVISFINHTRKCNWLFPSNVENSRLAVTPRRKNHSTIAVRSSLSDGSNVVFEKDFEFKPSFDEYLKAMESVRTDRDNRDNTVIRTKRKSIRKTRREDEEEDDEWSIDKEDSRKGISLTRNVSFQEGSRKGLHSSSELIEKRKIIFNRNLSANRSGSSEHKLLSLERAAFRSLENEDDLIDKPRISRVNMEERIQRLSKCLNGADIDMPEWKFSQMMRSAQIRFSDHSIKRVIQILGGLGNWRRVLQVIEWIQSRERFKSHKIRHIYNAALDALGKARRPVEAFNLFLEMQRQMASYPDIVAYRSVAITLGQAGHMKELFDVIDSMRSPPQKKFKTGFLEKWDPRLEPDVIVYNAVLNACVHRKKWEGAFWVLQQISLRGEQPSMTTYGLVMEVMLACEKYSLVHDFFKKVQKAYIPNALIYKVLMNALWREGKTDEAIWVAGDMERRGIVGSAGLYYDLARCLCSAGRCHDALKQIGKICRVANKPLVVTYTGLIQACLDSGNIQSAEFFFDHMQKFCSPNLITCNIMMKAFIDHGMFERAKELFLRMLDNAKFIKYEDDYKVRVIPDIYSFNTMLEACSARQKWDDLEFVYSQMLTYGHHFNEKRHLRLILDARRSGKGELLEKTWKHLAVGGRVPPHLLVIEMFCKRLEESDCVAALACFTNTDVELRLFSRKLWSKFFSENGKRLEKGLLVKLRSETSILAARSENPALEHLMKSCEEFLRTQTKASAERVSISQSEPVLAF